jgi:hypothetical protein
MMLDGKLLLEILQLSVRCLPAAVRCVVVS